MIAPQRLHQIQALLSATEYRDAALHPLPGDASFRRYVRVQKNGRSAMLMDAPPDKEDVRPFVSVAEYLCARGYSAPRILARDVESGLLLLEDLGSDSYSAVLARQPQNAGELYAAAIDVLAAWHAQEGGIADPAALALPRYDEALLMREVDLFSEWFLPRVAGDDVAAQWAAEYAQTWRDILASSPLATSQLVHRDYHADNLMWLPGRAHVERVGLLDFQDGVYGDAAYDLVSLLEDARRDVAPELAQQMLARYLALSGANRDEFMTAYGVLGAQRNCKIIGIFTRLAVRDGKAHYLRYMPRVWRHLEHDLQHPALAPLKRWMDAHVPADKRGVPEL